MYNPYLYPMNHNMYRRAVNNNYPYEAYNKKILAQSNTPNQEDKNCEKGFNIGEPAPEFTLSGIVNGEPKEVSLSDYQGKWVVVFFYGSDFTFV
ncbi:Peroxiredoxin [Maledivibacter halophilus]|uniref:Peroxiredoxin n=1 Tax=Maledivibacter halophilus TaxID=36842 RepID=A0A1T5LCG6_9FIRM|nr:Peroxiredoxin [Maledivibacter halophilus]